MVTLTDLERGIRKELINFVKIGDPNKSFVRYKALADKFGLPFENEHERGLLYKMLDNINRHEDKQKRPLLSVVVVTEDYVPGKGFFTMSRELGKQEPDEDDDRYALRERKEVFDFWKNNVDPDA